MKKFTGMILTAMLLLLTFSGVGYGQNIGATNTAKYMGDGRYNWTVYIVTDKDTLNKISYVQYTLHPTFDPPLRTAKNSSGQYPFSISANGWGEFTIGVKVVFKDRKFTSFDYQLKLFPKKSRK